MQHFIEFRFEHSNSLVVVAAAHMDVIMELAGVIKFYGGGGYQQSSLWHSASASYGGVVRWWLQPCFASTSDTGSGREEEGWRIELDSCTRGETAPKSDRLKVQQVVLRTEEEEEMGWAVEEEEELGARLRVVWSP